MCTPTSYISCVNLLCTYCVVTHCVQLVCTGYIPTCVYSIYFYLCVSTFTSLPQGPAPSAGGFHPMHTKPILHSGHGHGRRGGGGYTTASSKSSRTRSDESVSVTRPARDNLQQFVSHERAGARSDSSKGGGTAIKVDAGGGDGGKQHRSHSLAAAGGRGSGPVAL